MNIYIEKKYTLYKLYECVGSAGEVLCDVHPQEFSAADSLHSRAVDGQWRVVTRVSPEAHHNLLCLTHIEEQIVCTTPFSLLCHFISVVCFIVVADETAVEEQSWLGPAGTKKTLEMMEG